MAVMTCPKCGGCGEITLGNNSTSMGFCKSTCPSCDGSGYVSDTSFTEEHYLKCPECGKTIRIQLGHYLALPDTAKKL